MLITGVHHIAIICSNYEVSKHFYTQTLGFQVIHEAYRQDRDSYKLDLKVDDHTQLELFSFPNPPKRPTRPEACGLRHLAFTVTDVPAYHQYLLDQNVPTEDIRTDEFTHKQFFFCLDPDGLPIEIYEHP
ncbi:MAG: VOC family protein [Vampirovibrio sp.]|nr:VOC family protein [Vampirovibrio sp.]